MEWGKCWGCPNLGFLHSSLLGSHGMSGNDSQFFLLPMPSWTWENWERMGEWEWHGGFPKNGVGKVLGCWGCPRLRLHHSTHPCGIPGELWGHSQFLMGSQGRFGGGSHFFFLLRSPAPWTWRTRRGWESGNGAGDSQKMGWGKRLGASQVGPSSLQSSTHPWWDPKGILGIIPSFL